MPRAHLAAAAALALAVACKEPTVPHPLANQFRYTCCNLHYEKPEITDANYLRGTLIPFGTRIQILEVRKDSVTFKAGTAPAVSPWTSTSTASSRPMIRTRGSPSCRPTGSRRPRSTRPGG